MISSTTNLCVIKGNKGFDMNKLLILRLSKYKRVTQKLKTLGFEKVFSNNLGDALGITPALVRKDLSRIDLPGNKRGGYNIDVLLDRLNTVLGLEEKQRIIIVGCGKIGTALMQYKEFAKEGISVVAGFDIAPEKFRNSGNIPIYDIQELPNFVQEQNIKVAILSVPDAAAARALDIVTRSGIKGVLNFAPVDLKAPLGCIIHNVNIGLEIENLTYLVNLSEKAELPVE